MIIIIFCLISITEIRWISGEYPPSGLRVPDAGVDGTARLIKYGRHVYSGARTSRTYCKRHNHMCNYGYSNVLDVLYKKCFIYRQNIFYILYSHFFEFRPHSTKSSKDFTNVVVLVENTNTIYMKIN